MNQHRMRIATGAAVLTLAATLTACGNTSSHSGHQTSASAGAEASSSEHNAADVSFATAMIPHHDQAVQMAKMTQGRYLDPAVQKLADAIEAAQAPEIETMTGWLTAWGEPVPASSGADAHAGHDMEGPDSMDGMDGPDSMDGMMSADEMTALGQAKGAEFQTMWLELMIRHHEGAVAMSETELKDGKYQPAIDLAGAIIKGQQAEIDTMRTLLK